MEYLRKLFGQPNNFYLLSAISPLKSSPIFLHLIKTSESFLINIVIAIINQE